MCVCVFKWSYHITGETKPQIDIICYKYNTPKPGSIFYSHQLKGSYKPSNITGYSNAIAYPLQPDRKTLLLKTSYIYVIKHGEIELVLNWKPHPYRAAFITLNAEGIIHAPGEEK